MTAIDGDTRLCASEDCVATEMEGEIVILNHSQGTYQGIQGIGTTIWEMTQEPTTVADLLARIEQEYEDRPPDWEHEVTDFVSELISHDLIEIVDEPNP